ncbi:MAG: hypothetical protein Q8P02_04065 [Candidatus Micrarchaeota archaeon]|nr:hypothetical protein [Candidatus Micrarchaeota archaeon]
MKEFIAHVKQSHPGLSGRLSEVMDAHKPRSIRRLHIALQTELEAQKMRVGMMNRNEKNPGTHPFYEGGKEMDESAPTRMGRIRIESAPMNASNRQSKLEALLAMLKQYEKNGNRPAP